MLLHYGMIALLSKYRLPLFIGSTLYVLAASAAHADEPARLIHAVEAAGHHVPPIPTLRSSCDDDMLCIARFLKERIGDGAALIPDDGRQQEARSSWQRAAALTDLGNGKVALWRFDARAIVERFKATKLELLDLRRTMDDDLDQMRRVAGLFAGDVERAFTVTYINGRQIDWTVSAPREGLLTPVPEIWVGPETGVASVLLAVLLKKHAKAVVRGEPTQKSAFLTTDIPVTHGWKLRVPWAILAVPDFDLSVGIVPEAIGNK